MSFNNDGCTTHHFGNLMKHVFKFYSDKVTKKGKPQGSEFTIFAALVLVDCSNNSIPQEKKFIVCSIGTGTKCIGHDLIEKDINNGYLLHDCHAEVMARRSFMKFMYNLMESGKCSEYFDWVEEVERWKLKNNFELYMILTELPCGDCSIVNSPSTVSSGSETIEQNSQANNEEQLNKSENNQKQRKKVILEGRTGSKIIHNDSCTHEKFGEDQTINLVRLKPGGGSRNQSMSCSDKITKWNVVGIQGSLLSNFFEPIFVDKFLILLSEKSKLDLELTQQRLNQSIVDRVDQLSTKTPSFYLFKEGVSNIPHFSDRASETKIKGSGYSIGSYLNLAQENQSHVEEVVIGMKGHKQGTTKKDENTPKAATQLSKHIFFKSFINCIKRKELSAELAQLLENKEPNMKTYHEIKKRESTYVIKLNTMKSQPPFDKWIIKKNI
ncbi:tRNA-specific adenosine deaminase [Naegleria gruberi]|uniref:tRNA-specific adenosine deaminase 1 n=1 Tax=Naegleria gruberi TaxID=5762 RepID=D2V2D7_NAEGR|nr:tRNA-specific adenosine deaminase [Naegleria gruberi]EFC49040.1 tRNA-specific adenosine deaminase [Naegleria gruberi]|eukprot:XP_002681784.1 tRNA-specific adenosine deaminase [Naegleria gruberi strain NEG-M]